MKIQNLQNLMVSIAMKQNQFGDPNNVGLPVVFRSRQEQAQLTTLYERAAAINTPNLNIDRLNRQDATGNRQVDGGYLIFAALGQKTVTPKNLVTDLTKFGFHLSVVEFFQKEGDDKIRLRLTWSKNSLTKVQLDDRQKEAVRKYFNKTYWKLFGFFNPEAVSLEGDKSPIKGSIVTLNFSGMMAPNVEQNQMVREVRMTDADGHLACPIIQSPVVTPAAAPYRCPERTPARLAATLGEAYDKGLGAK